MLHPLFVGVVTGPSFNMIMPPHVHKELYQVAKTWAPIWKRKPPDPELKPVIDVYVSYPEQPVHEVNATTTYSVSRRKTASSKQRA